MVSAAKQIAALQRSNAIARSVRGVISEFIKPLPRDIPRVILLEAPFIGARNTEQQDLLIRREHVARDRRFSADPISITGFGELP